MEQKNTNDKNKKDNEKKSVSKESSPEVARNEAMKDIDQDPDLSMNNPNDDLDEGEAARLGEEKTGMI